MTSKQVQEDNETMSDDIYKLLKKYQAIRSIIKTLGVSKYRNTTQARPGSLLPFSHHAEGLVKHKSHEKRLLILDTPDRACRFIQTPSTQGRVYSKVWPMLSIFDSNKQKTPLEISVVFDRWGAVL
jgi:hypothetical protein